MVIISLFGWTVLSNHYLKRSIRESFRELALIGLGMIPPLLAYVVFQYIRAGTLKGLLYWTLGYAVSSDYNNLAVKWPSIGQIKVIAAASLLLIVAFHFLIDLMRRKNLKWMHFGWGFILLIASSFTVYPRFEYFHLQTVLPALTWLSALTLAHAWQSVGNVRLFVKGIVLALSLFWLIWGGLAYVPSFLTFQKPQKIVEYSKLKNLASDLRGFVGISDRVYVFPDSEGTANLYYLLKKLPPKYWIFHYPWYMTESIKRKILVTLRREPPEWIVYLPGRWKIEQFAPEIVSFLQTHYQREAKLNRGRSGILLLRYFGRK
jgi:hypothetical protein